MGQVSIDNWNLGGVIKHPGWAPAGFRFPFHTKVLRSEWFACDVDTRSDVDEGARDYFEIIEVDTLLCLMTHQVFWCVVTTFRSLSVFHIPTNTFHRVLHFWLWWVVIILLEEKFLVPGNPTLLLTCWMTMSVFPDLSDRMADSILVNIISDVSDSLSVSQSVSPPTASA